MSHSHAPRTVERQCEVAVVGGSAAGLAAALQLGRQRRSVIVIDAGEPRNASADHLHGYLGHDGAPPADLTGIGRDEVRRYGGEVLQGRVQEVHRLDDGRFRLALVGGHAVVARRVLVATGLVDELPDLPGVAEHWGGDVVHCPFCHGYEVRDRRIVQVLTHPMGLHPAPLFRQLSDRLTVVVHDGAAADAARLEELAASGVEIVHGVVTGVVATDGRITGVELAGREPLPAEIVVVGPRFSVPIAPFAPLGLTATPHPSDLGDHVAVDATGQTAVPGLYAAGNVADPSQQLLQAAADGARTAAMIAFSLAEEDLADDRRSSGNAEDWEHRYRGEQMWSGNPNGSLVAEAEALRPGRALDVGAGEGGDAIWLAEQGWAVTANDIAQGALDRIAGAARERGLDVTLLCADANARDAFEREAYDLVSAQYASIPRTADDRAITNLLGAVAPGGTLVAVSHDIEPMRAPIDTSTQSRAFDADAYVRVEDLAAALTDAPGWEIEVHEKRPRPPGSATAAHHVDDIVLRARRRS